MAKVVFDRPVMIFRSEYYGRVFYSYGLSKKDRDGEYINGYMSCKFRKDIDIPNKTLIKVNDAWQDFYISKNGRTVNSVFINEFDYVENQESDEKEVSLDDILGSENIDIEALELPFDE